MSSHVRDEEIAGRLGASFCLGVLVPSGPRRYHIDIIRHRQAFIEMYGFGGGKALGVF